MSAFEQQVVELTNQERAKNGLPALKLDVELSKVARDKSKICKQKITLAIQAQLTDHLLI